MPEECATNEGLERARFGDWLRRAGKLLPGLLLLLACAARAQTNLTLHDAIARAQTSPAARIAGDEVELSRGYVRQAGLGLNPRLYLQSEDLRPWDDRFSFANNTEDYGYLQQVLELDGKRRKRVGVANANLRRTQAEQTFQLQLLAGRVAGAYWSAVASQRVADLLQQDLAAVDEMVRYHRERVDAGAMRGVDLLRMQIERDRVAMQLQTARRDMELTRVELFRQIGTAPSPDVVLSDSLTGMPPLPPVTVEAALSRRADLQAARESVGAAEADLRLQHALAYPDPDLQGGYKRNSGFDTLFTAVQIPLPVRNRNQGEILRAEAALRIAKEQLVLAETTVRAEIDAATRSYRAEQEIIERTLPDMQDRARQNLQILNEAYRTGGVDLLRLIDAQRTAIEVEVNAFQTLANFRQTALRLQLANGVQP